MRMATRKNQLSDTDKRKLDQHLAAKKVSALKDSPVTSEQLSKILFAHDCQILCAIINQMQMTNGYLINNDKLFIQFMQIRDDILAAGKQAADIKYAQEPVQKDDKIK